MATVDRLTRKPVRGDDSRAALDALLDEVLVGILTAVVDGQPWTVPMLFARDGDRVLLHGSTGAGTLAASGAPVTFAVFSLDAIVVAHTAFESSANYRSAVLRGSLVPLPREERDAALATLTDRLVPGRSTEVPGNTGKEIAATTVLSLAIEEGSWLSKARTGPAGPPDPTTDPATWAGVVPLHTVAGRPQPEEWVRSEPPASVRRLLDRWPEPAPAED